MGNKKEIKVDKLCIKYSYGCKWCPKYAKCNKDKK